MRKYIDTVGIRGGYCSERTVNLICPSNVEGGWRV